MTYPVYRTRFVNFLRSVVHSCTRKGFDICPLYIINLCLHWFRVPVYTDRRDRQTKLIIIFNIWVERKEDWMILSNRGKKIVQPFKRTSNVSQVTTARHLRGIFQSRQFFLCYILKCRSFWRLLFAKGLECKVVLHTHILYWLFVSAIRGIEWAIHWIIPFGSLYRWAKNLCLSSNT